MKTLIIYDRRGVIYYRATGDYEIPEGLNYLEIEIPEGKILQSVNPVTKEPVYTDMPASDIDVLTEKINYLTERLAAVEESQTVQDGAITDLGEVASTLAEQMEGGLQ